VSQKEIRGIECKYARKDKASYALAQGLVYNLGALCKWLVDHCPDIARNLHCHSPQCKATPKVTTQSNSGSSAGAKSYEELSGALSGATKDWSYKKTAEINQNYDSETNMNPLA
jgi:hypothetical protein